MKKHEDDIEALVEAAQNTDEPLQDVQVEEPVDEGMDDDGDDIDEDEHISLRDFFGGDVLEKRLVMKQTLFICFIVVLMLLYTGNRYASQEDVIAIDSLKQVLQEKRYNVLTQSSELMNLTRQSKVEERLRLLGDSSLLSSHTPPFAIVRPED